MHCLQIQYKLYSQECLYSQLLNDIESDITDFANHKQTHNLL